MAFDPRSLDELARKLADAVPPGLTALKNDLEQNFKAVLQGGLAKLDLVTRQEFDIQVSRKFAVPLLEHLDRDELLSAAAEIERVFDELARFLDAIPRMTPIADVRVGLRRDLAPVEVEEGLPEVVRAEDPGDEAPLAVPRRAADLRHAVPTQAGLLRDV